MFLNHIRLHQLTLFRLCIQVPMEDLQNASKLLVQALGVRERYMRMSRQRFPNVCQSFLRRLDGDDDIRPAEKPRARSGTLSDDKATIEGTYMQMI